MPIRIGYIDAKTKVWPQFSLRLNQKIMYWGGISLACKRYPWIAEVWRQDMMAIKSYNDYLRTIRPWLKS